MVRAIWKGEIAFGLVTIPVSLVSTEENHDIHFHLLNAETQSRIRYQRIDENTGEEVPWESIVKGYEYNKGNYIIINDEQFEKASPELFKTINIEEFVELQDIDNLYYTKPYYLVPEGKNKKAYVLLREALKKTSKVGVAKTMLKTKEYLSLIFAHNNTLLLYLVHFKDEIRSEDELEVPKNAVKNYKVTDEEINIAVDLIENMSTHWEPEKYHNNYREALKKWLDKQIKARTQPKVSKSSTISRTQDGVVDFISLLKESMQNTSFAKKKSVNKH